MLSLILIVIMLLSCACLKPVSLEDYGYVISIGIDKGREKKYYITLMLQRQSSGQDSSSEGGAMILADEGGDIFDAINNIESNLPYLLNFSRTNFLIFGKAAAQEGLVKDFFEIPLDTLRIRATAILLFADGTASELIGGLASNNDDNLTKLQKAILLDRDMTGMVTVMNAGRLYEAAMEQRLDFSSAIGTVNDDIITDMQQKKSESEGENPIKDLEAGEKTGGLKSVITGSALFDGWIMTGELNREETMLLNIVNGEFSSGLFLLPSDEGESTTVRIELKKANKVFAGTDENNEPVFRISIDLYAAVYRNKRYDNAKNAETEVCAEIRDKLEEELRRLDEKCKLANSDVMRLGACMSTSFSSAKDWEEYGWKKHFAGSVTIFEVNIESVDMFSAEGLK